MASANTMVHKFEFPPETANRPPKSDARKMNKGGGRGKMSENIHKINFKSIAKLGLGIRQVRMANEMVGAYTGDKLTQRQGEKALTFLQYGIGIAYAGPIGVAYAVGDMAYRSINYEINRSRENQTARFLRDLSGNNSRNHSRSSGEKL